MENLAPDIFLAKWVYRSFASIAFQTLGPAWRISSDAMKIAETLGPAMNAIVGQAMQSGSDLVWDVPSPWHAALYLSALQHHLSLEGQRVLFRGQNNSAWQVNPSIIRPGVDRDMERRKGQLFCDLLASLSFNTVTSFHPSLRQRFDLHVPSRSYWAAAQHYGIKTDLIDFTTDPAIAVFFACSGANPAAGQTSSVIAIHLDVALGAGCEVILPPPFTERLYIQRGVFVRSDVALDRTRFGMTEIRFPSTYPFAPFEVVRSDGTVNVLPDSKPLSELLRVIEENSKSDASNMQRAADKLKSSFFKLYGDPLSMWAKYVDFFEDQLYWLAYRVDESQEALVMNVLKPIVLANREVAAAAGQFYRWSAKLPPEDSGYTEEKKNHLLTLANLLEEIVTAG